MRNFSLALSALFTVSIVLTASGAPIRDVFPGVIIVKLKEANAKNRGSDSPVSKALAVFGASLGEPVWNQGFDRAREKRMRAKGFNSAQEESANGFKRTFKVRIADHLDPVEVVRSLQKLQEIEYVEPVYMHYTKALPNDSDVGINGHRYFKFMKFDKAYDQTTGSEEIIIAIVDSGVDYLHSELDSKLWTNPNEIAGNKIDDDNNGFVDDVKGWDFWDSGVTFSTLIEDNDPMGTGSDHGTHVAGTAAAETNNNFGIAGTGYRCKYMAVKAGGIVDDPSTSGDDSRSIGFGYEGILYAVNNGAHVVNNSWGGGFPSSFGRDVVAYAKDNNVVVVCAASNEGDDAPSYPAAYDGSISVAALGSSTRDTALTKASFSNYSYTVDVAATGTRVHSTIFGNAFGVKSGTSMSSPIVAGLAGLVRTKYPDWTAERIAAQIRASATNIDAQNNAYRNRLGNGLINAEKAVKTPLPALTISSYTFITEAGIKPRPGDTGTLTFILRNVGETATFSLALTALQAGISFGSFESNFSVATGESRSVQVPVSIESTYNAQIIPAIKAAFSVPSVGYSDFGILQIADFNYAAHDNNYIQTSFGADGSMGFQTADDLNTGIGFSAYSSVSERFSDNMVYESGLMISINNVIYNKVRNATDTDAHFNQLLPFRVRKLANGTQIGNGTFNLNGKAGAPPVLITQESFSFTEGALKNAIIVRFKMENLSDSQTLTNVYAGIFSDWDLGNYSANRARFVESDTVMYVTDPSDTGIPLVATVPYKNISSIFAINNGYTGPQSNLDFGLYPDANSVNGGFTDQEKMWSLTNGIGKTTQIGVDISTVNASGPFTIPAGQSVSFSFIHAVGSTEQELLDAVRAAKALNIFELSTSAESVPFLPDKTGLLSAYPNPFNPTTNLTFSLQEAGKVQFDVFNMIGQRVLSIGSKNYSAGQHVVGVQASSLTSGVYLVRMTAGNLISTRKITLMK